MRPLYEELRKSGKKCEKVIKIGKNWEKVIKSDAPIFLTVYEALHMKLLI